MIAWDQDGNAMYAEPSRYETEQHRAALVAALDDAARGLGPIADEAKIELAAVRASRPAVEPWSAWASRVVDEVVAASSTWPGPPDITDDDRLDCALTELAKATDALAAVFRGDPAAPAPPEPDPGRPPIFHDPLAEHKALLDRARPYARVNHRPYDPTLRAELAAAAEQAASIPPVISALAIGLDTTCHLAAAVAGNADDTELASLVEQDARRRPLSAAVLLLSETARVADGRGRSEPQRHAEAALVALWESLDFSDPDAWDVDDANTGSVLWAGTRVTSAEQVVVRLSQALARQPAVLLPLVTACADWVETDPDDVRPGEIRRRYRELPAWFPTEAVVEVAPSVAPGAASVAVDAFGETDGDDAESLLAQILWLAQRECGPTR